MAERDASPVLPEMVRVAFRPQLCSGKPTDKPPDRWVVEIPIGLAGLEAWTGHPGSKTFHSTAQAKFVGGDTAPTNKGDLNALSLQVAIDFYGWRAQGRDVTYNGIVAVLPTGSDEEICWTYREGECHTRITSGPYGDEPEEMHHEVDDPCEGTGTGGSVTVYAPPAKRSGKHITLPKIKLQVVDGVLKSSPAGSDPLYACCDCAICVTVLGCCEDTSGVEGATVTVTLEGVEVPDSPCHTDKYGNCCVPISASGTYHVTVIPPDGYAVPPPVDVEATCPEGGAHAVIFNLTVADPVNNACGPCPNPIPRTVTANDGFGDISLVYDAATKEWVGCVARQVTPVNIDGYHYGWPVGKDNPATGCTCEAYVNADPEEVIEIPIRFRWKPSCPATHGASPGSILLLEAPSCLLGGGCISPNPRGDLLDPTQTCGSYPWPRSVTAQAGGANNSFGQVDCDPLHAEWTGLMNLWPNLWCRIYDCEDVVFTVTE